MEKYRIKNIQNANLNNLSVILFDAYKYDADSKAYIFCGEFIADENTPENNLVNFITKDFDDSESADFI